ncbi:MAG TPA: sugar transferase [Terracidiphilus sp.]|nr:sugar transferase [Terracidiphilus sp.]
MEVLTHLPESSTRMLPVSTLQVPAPQARANAVVSFIEPVASPWSVSTRKRVLDICAAILVLAVFALPMLAITLLVRLTSPGPALFRQRRSGRGGRLFVIYKFRSMTIGSGAGLGLTKHGDCRITTLGRWLRKIKLDELPQFYNVLRGDMSLVGPRPKLPQYAVLRNLPCRPGITGAATLAFRREEELLSRIHPAEMENFYHRHIKPLKARIDARYMCRATFWTDLRIIAATFLACLSSPRIPAVVRKAGSHAIAFQPLAAVETASGDSLGRSN